MPTPGPWIVRGEAEPDEGTEALALGVEPATEDRPGSWSYLIRQDQAFGPGRCPLHLATGIQRLADAALMAAAPELAEALLRLLTSAAVTARDLDPGTRSIRDEAWGLLARVAPHLEIGS